MPRTAQKVDELADEGEHMTDALGEVLAIAEEKGTLTWADVSDDISSGQWGRLIEKGLLIDAGEGFVVDDPDGVREALDEADPTATESEDTSWSTYDKMAAVAVLGLFVGYALPAARQAIGSTINFALGPIEAVLPFYLVVLMLAMLTGLFSSLLQDNLMEMGAMSQMRERSQELKERREAAKERGDDEALEEIQQEQMEMMSENIGAYKQMFRPMVWTMLTVIPVFLWIYWMVLDVGITVSSPVIVLPIFGEIEAWRTGVVGPMEAWLVWYFICSLGFTQIIRKSLNVQTSPG